MQDPFRETMEDDAPVRERSEVTSGKLVIGARALYNFIGGCRNQIIKACHCDPRELELDNYMFARILSIVGLASAGLLLILITSTTPEKAGAFGILAVFLLTYTIFATAFTFLIWLLAKVANKLGGELRVLRNPYGITIKKSYYYASVLALGPVIVISLQSVGGISVYELGLVVLFLFLGCVYVAKRAA